MLVLGFLAVALGGLLVWVGVKGYALGSALKGQVTQTPQAQAVQGG